MKVIAFISKKGGCGKSTTVSALGLYLAEAGGKRVAVQDMEINGLSSTFVRKTQHPLLTLYEDGEEYDYVLIDTEGNIDTPEMAEVERLADLIVIPTALTPPDIMKAYETEQLLSDHSKTRLLQVSVRTNTNAWRDRRHSFDAFKSKRLKTAIRQRTAYQYFLTDGWGGLKRDRGAMKELKSLAKELK